MLSSPYILALQAGLQLDPALVGNKAASLAAMAALGLPVPPAFVVTTRACGAFLEEGSLPRGLERELDAGIADLEAATGRRFGTGPLPLLLSVRSGAAISMPGMMDTVLNLGICAEAEAALAAETGLPTFARDTRDRFEALFTQIVGTAPPVDPRAQLLAAVRAVFESWNSRRARRWRDHQGIPHTLGTAVTVQAMVFGNRCARSGTGVLFSRNPLSGANEPYGEWLPRAQGEDIVSGRVSPQPLVALQAAQPEVAAALLHAARRLEAAAGDAQDIEFTVEGGRLWLLQTRTAKRSPRAAVRMAFDMAEEGLIVRETALARVSDEQLAQLLRPGLDTRDIGDATVLARGEAAAPGVGQGRLVLDSDEAERRAGAGEAVVLARPTTSPEDVHGMIAAAAIVTELGGSTSHAAVVGRSLGKPVVVGCGAGVLQALAGMAVTADGGRGMVLAGLLSLSPPRPDPVLETYLRWRSAAAPAG
jgi:pyruvate,orthophosphate dikinase